MTEAGEKEESAAVIGGGVERAETPYANVLDHNRLMMAAFAQPGQADSELKP
ncbi:hypothetical protein EV13_0291 [Prochlorococcus sp. MIT 0702]|nr:hypothetical protein EV12_1287 [Prochlorococcus sp. MIT 0701]KGG30415.1 hypothetical protein EV13_0291 [Prochlorococcus sp. MIT 0702]KGG36535.1 hypothetical protein EV14_0268 [Prochlorococcus sp. MIT 0703]